jgi:hypothetical protein
MTNDHDADEDMLAGIDLHAWRVPTPPTIDRSSLVASALSPALRPAKRARLAWLVAAIVVVNAVIAAIIAIVVLPTSTATPTVAARPAGGGVDEDRVNQILQRLDQEQRELEDRLAEIDDLRALVIELSEKVRQYEQRTVPKQPPRSPVDPPAAQPIDDSCDEVSCVLQNYEGACCTKFTRPRALPKHPAANELPEALDRMAISQGVAAVKGRVSACAVRSAEKGVVRIRVHVDAAGAVTEVEVVATPDPALGECVETVMKRAVFARTKNGGSFSYPFVF